MGEYEELRGLARRERDAAGDRGRPLQRARDASRCSTARCATLRELGLERLGRRCTGCRARSRSRSSPSGSRRPARSTPSSASVPSSAATPPHFDYVAGQCAAGVARGRSRHRRPGRSSACSRPTTSSRRSTAPAAAEGNKGVEAARTAVEMVDLLRELALARKDARMLSLVLPKGSLEQATLQLFEDADLRRSRSSDVDYRATIDDPRVDEVRILRPQEIPRYVADGLFDVGITGRDWIEETGRGGRDAHRAPLLQGDRAPDPGRARGRRGASAAVGDRPPGRCPRPHRVPGADEALLPGARDRRRQSRSPTARPRRRSPTSPMRSSRSPRRGGRCEPPGCGSSTRCSSRTRS